MARFLNNEDYLGIITKDALAQITRGREECIPQAEEAAESSIIEYLTDHYKIEEVLAEGKNILPYNPQVTYSVGQHFYYDNKICRALSTIQGRCRPTDQMYWREAIMTELDLEVVYPKYEQQCNYFPGDIVRFQETYYICHKGNGPDFLDIRVPGVDAWFEAFSPTWQANIEYKLWNVVRYEGGFYCLINDEGVDQTKNPLEYDKWGLIAPYEESYNQYEFSEHEYVVYNNKVFYPIIPVNADELQMNVNIIQHDPRNPNIKKHMVRLALYELFKLISPNNVSEVRITDYTTSIQWLRDASKLRINPHIPRKVDECERPITDWQVATFRKDFDPYENNWLT